jgi:hypothetical protein
MEIDARGLTHPEHIKEFKRHIEGLCAVYEDMDLLIDNNRDDLRKMESYIRSCRAAYTVDQENDYVRIKIKAPFSLCG